jgi:hypothetical protein
MKNEKLINSICRNAVEYENITGRKLGITGEIGELSACDVLGWELNENPQVAGYDALDKNRKRYQIKSRRVDHKKGRIGRFSEHKFDFAILVVLDENYKILEIWETSYKKLEPILDEKRNPSFSKFKKISKIIYPKN